jgi:hypothetical protein
MIEKRGIITEQTPDSPVEKGCSGKCTGACSTEKQAEDIHDRHIASRLADEAADAFRRK